jgi:transcriptional regulator GlxA family with amidase domain
MAATQRRRPINVAILAFEMFVVMAITGPMDILNKSSAVWDRIHRVRVLHAPFHAELVSLTRKQLHFEGFITLHPHVSVVTAKKPDRILIASAGENVIENLDRMRPFIPWITLCARRGTRAVSLWTGAFLLAETELLDGHAATTHWFLADVFRRAYPKVKLQPERLILDEGNVITSGAATSFLHRALYLIELYNGHQARSPCCQGVSYRDAPPNPVPSHYFRDSQNEQ